MSWKEIKKSVNSDLNTPLNELLSNLSTEEVTLLNNIISKLDNSTYGLSALKTILDTINTNITGGSSSSSDSIIKSIQRGYVILTRSDNNEMSTLPGGVYTTVEFNQVDTTKCIVLLNDNLGAVNGPLIEEFNLGTSLYELTDTSFTVFQTVSYYSRYYKPGFSWQVIEFK